MLTLSHDVTPGQFESVAHYGAWMRGEPMRTTRTRRGKVRTKYRDLVFKHDGYKCVHCGSRELLTFGHIVPWVFGGTDEPCNGQTECGSCNERQFTADYDALLKRANAA